MPISTKPRQRYFPKTREHKTYGLFEIHVGPDGNVHVDYDADGRLFSPQARDGTYSLSTSYDRGSDKKKFVFAHNLQKNGIFMDPNWQLINDFSVLIAIDTNTLMIQGQRVSATCLMTSKGLTPDSKGELEFDVDKLVTFNVPLDVNPEMVAIDIALRHFAKISDAKIGIITDSELGRHLTINRRAVPFLGNKLLAENVQLMYASSDTGSAFPNRLVKQCDKLAKVIIGHCQDYPIELGPPMEDYEYCHSWIVFTDSSDQ